MFVRSFDLHKQDCCCAPKVERFGSSIHHEQSGSKTPKFHHVRKLILILDDIFVYLFSIFSHALIFQPPSKFHEVESMVTYKEVDEWEL